MAVVVAAEVVAVATEWCAKAKAREGRQDAASSADAEVGAVAWAGAAVVVAASAAAAAVVVESAATEGGKRDPVQRTRRMARMATDLGGC